MKTNSNFPFELKMQKSSLVGTFTDIRNAKEVRRLLEIGCIYNELGSTRGRVIETEKGIYSVYAIK